MKLIHGGDVAGYEAEYGAKPLDFSANINPLGLPQGVRQAVIGALDSADAYPDPLCRKLRQAIARQEGLPMEQILCGNGAADLIFRLVLALRPKKALVTAPLLPNTSRRWPWWAARCSGTCCWKKTIFS